jgi:hypothetical protein
MVKMTTGRQTRPWVSSPTSRQYFVIRIRIQYLVSVVITSDRKFSRGLDTGTEWPLPVKHVSQVACKTLEDSAWGPGNRAAAPAATVCFSFFIEYLTGNSCQSASRIEARLICAVGAACRM